MQKFYLFASIVFLFLGFSHILLSSVYIDIFSIVTFGQKGVVGIIIPVIYTVISLLFALFLKKGTANWVMILLSSIALVVNLLFVFIAIYGFQEP